MQDIILYFKDAAQFEDWLNKEQASSKGVFLRFDKSKATSSLTPDQALLIALSYGWIDGLIKRMDQQFYIKYFAPRGKKSIWSSKNKRLAEELIRDNKMHERGLYEVERAKIDGRWEKADLLPEDFSLTAFFELLKDDALAYQHYQLMSPSIQKTYAISYYVLKKEDSRSKRLGVILQRLRDNLKPM